MIVTEVKSVRNSKKKVEVCLDNGTGFTLYKREAYRYNLEEGYDLSEEEYEKLLREIFIPRAKSRAMHLLLDQDRSEHELRTKLKRNGYPEEAILEAISYVKKFKYLDDERMARNYVRIHQNAKSERILVMDLKKKGISDSLIEIALDEEHTASSDELIMNWLRKRHYVKEEADEKEKAKQYRFLLGKGFSSSDVMKFL
ncbi:MAG: regulatory protein RecX [Lachnospiraceae bacterium]|nr:regulatory protein RecX [Lachnospiraceae bacterium]